MASDSAHLPLIPGYSFRDATKDDHRKSQTLGYKNGYALKKVPVVGIGGEIIPNTVAITEQHIAELQLQAPDLQFGKVTEQQAPARTIEFVPSHVAFDKLVLRFDAFFKQTVHESPDERYRVRKVKIHYYVEDDSISVMEPPVENSGIPQGVLIKRQKLPKNPMGDSYVFTDFNVGFKVEFYGKVFKIVDCDQFTRSFLAQKGIEVHEPLSFPDDPYTIHRNNQGKRQPQPAERDDKLKKFLENDRKVLRFYCVWDDRDSMFGDIRPFIMHYFLVDDTVEVSEVQAPNHGRCAFPVLLKRRRLPKNFADNAPMSVTSADIDCYGPEDFSVGTTINLFGRKFLMYDCDTYTRNYYKTTYNRELADPIVMSSGRATPKERPVPPYNGFGSEADSLGSCISLVPKPPRKDFIKMLENEHKILRFSALMDSTKPEDQGRAFIVSYRLSDDHMTIYEPPQRNAGIIGGKFLERTRVRKPGSCMSNPTYYTPQDLYIGARIEIFCHKFILIDADEYCLRHMEEHSALFPQANFNVVRPKLKMALEGKEELLLTRLEAASVEEDLARVEALKSILLHNEFSLGDYLSQHEILTVLRYLADSDGNIRISCIRAHLPQLSPNQEE